MKIPIDPLKFIPLAAWIVRLWAKTIRFEIRGDLTLLTLAKQSKKPHVLALWHGDLFSFIALGDRVSVRYAALVSDSKDGEIAARFLESLGVIAVRGSSSRGGVKALLRLKRIMAKDNTLGVFAADGPKGPRHQCKDGVIFMGHRADANIIAARAYPKWKKVLNSWDRFEVPLPFSKCVVHISEPMTVNCETLDKANLTKEKIRLNDVLNTLGTQKEQ